MSNRVRRGVALALAVVFMAALLGGCSLFKGKDKDDPFNEPEKTSSTRPADETTSAARPYASQPPGETYVEPARPWGDETRDNVNGQ